MPDSHARHHNGDAQYQNNSLPPVHTDNDDTFDEALVQKLTCDSVHATVRENDDTRHAHNCGPGDRGPCRLSLSGWARHAKALQTSCGAVPSSCLNCSSFSRSIIGG